MIVYTQVPTPSAVVDRGLGTDAPPLTSHVEMLRRVLPAFGHASISAADDTGALTTVAHVGDLARDLVELQHGAREGPSIDTLRTGVPVAAPDICRDDRWGTYIPAAAALGLRSQIAVPLLSPGSLPVGTLDLYSTTRVRISRSASAVAEAVAVQVVCALTGAREIEHLRLALEHRACIGQATGLVMSRLQVDADQAFSYLRRVSMDRNRKLAVVAEEIVRTRRLPSDTPERSARTTTGRRGG